MRCVIYWLCSFAVFANSLSQTLDGRVVFQTQKQSTALNLSYDLQQLENNFALSARLHGVVSGFSPDTSLHIENGGLVLNFPAFSGILGEGSLRTSRAFRASTSTSLLSPGSLWSLDSRSAGVENNAKMLLGFELPFIRAFRYNVYPVKNISEIPSPQLEYAITGGELSFATNQGLVSLAGSLLDSRDQLSDSLFQNPAYWLSCYLFSYFRALDVGFWAGWTRGYTTPAGIAAALELRFDSAEIDNQKKAFFRYGFRSLVSATDEWYRTYCGNFPYHDFYLKQTISISLGQVSLLSSFSAWSANSGSSIRRIFNPEVSVITKYAWLWMLDGADGNLSVSIPGWLLKTRFSWDINGIKRIEPSLKRDAVWGSGTITIAGYLKVSKAETMDETSDSEESNNEGDSEDSMADEGSVSPYLPLVVQGASIQCGYQWQLYLHEASRATAFLSAAARIPLAEEVLSVKIQCAGKVTLNMWKTTTLTISGKAEVALEAMKTLSVSSASVSISYTWKS